MHPLPVFKSRRQQKIWEKQQKQNAAKRQKRESYVNQAPFRHVERQFKSRAPLDVSQVVDFHHLDKNSDQVKENIVQVELAEDLRALSDIFGVSDDEWAKRARRGLVLKNVPGLIVIPNPFTPEAQRHLVKKCLSEYARPPNQSSLHAHYHVPAEGVWDLYAREQRGELKEGDQDYYVARKVASDASAALYESDDHDETESVAGEAKSTAMLGPSELLRKQRWVTLGYQYLWSVKEYDLDERHPMPENVSNLTRAIVRAVEGVGCEECPEPWKNNYKGDDFISEAGVINYYQMRDTLMGHVDRSELNMDAPLVSVRQSMSKFSPFTTTGVPRILENSLPTYLSSQNTFADQPDWDIYGRRLPQVDQLACIYVCSTWKDVVSAVVYHNIFVSSRRQFKLLFRSLCQSAERTDIPLGHHIRKLRLDHGVGFSRDEFEHLPKLCPFLNLLDFYPGLWNYLRFAEVLADWQQLRCLPQPAENRTKLTQSLLSIFPTCFVEQAVDVEDYEWLSQIQERSHIEKLSLTDALDSDTHISLSSIEEIHAKLPSLHSLDLFEVYLADNMLPADMVCSQAMRSIYITPKAGNLHLWIRYIAHKYPYLEELTIQQYNAFELLISDEVRNDINAAFRLLARSCRRLTSLNILCEHMFGVPDNQYDLPIADFAQEVRAVGGKLCKLEIPCQVTGLYQSQSLYKAIRYLQDTLTDVKIEFDFDATNALPDIIKALQLCSGLSRLELTKLYCEERFDFEIDSVRLHWPQLSYLELPFASISVPSSWATTSPHGLQCLDLYYAEVPEELFPYLAHVFPRLSNISLFQCAEMSTELDAREFVINMRGLKLKSLSIDADNDMFGAIKLSQADKTAKFLKRRQRRQKILEQNEDLGWTRWYYTDFEPKNQNCKVLRKLSNQEIQDVLRSERHISVYCSSVAKFDLLLTRKKK
ncbi:hypothetical protein DFQ28_011642 [Apophysomyces sp. BC1034]|nr:hypothetical protein DFQ28_011642 [Apophysomyces sp. BC1034]